MSEEKSLDTHPDGLYTALHMLKSTLINVESELTKLSAGNKSSAPRLRKFLMDLKNQAHIMRGSSTNYLKSLPKTPREKKVAAIVEVKPEIVPEPAQPVAKKARVKKPSAPKSDNKSDESDLRGL
jgi:hypothetical protein